MYDFTTPLGDYLCKATNDLGSTNRTIRLSKASKFGVFFLMGIILFSSVFGAFTYVS